MAINKPIKENGIDFKFGLLSAYNGGQTQKVNEDIYFVYTPDSAETGAAAYGTIFVNNIMFGSRVQDLVISNDTNNNKQLVFKTLSPTGTELVSTDPMAFITVEEHKHYNDTYTTVNNIVQQIGSIDGSILKNINVNGVDGTVANNIASVTVNASQIKMAGADSSTVAEKINAAIAAAGVTSFDNKTGDIKIDKADTGNNGTVKFATSADGTLSGTVRGLRSAAYEPTESFATAAQGTKADSAIQGVILGSTELTPDANKKVTVSAGDVSTLVSLAATAKSVADAEIAGIGEASANNSSHGVSVKVITAGGSVTGVEVGAPDIEQLAIDASNNAYDSAKAYIDASIQALSVSDSGSGYVSAVTQENGKIAVTKTALPSGTFTVKANGTNVSTFTDNAGTNAEVNFEGGNNITVSSSNGTITIAASAATTPNNGALSFKVGETTAATFTANQANDAPVDLAFASGNGYATVTAASGSITVSVNGTNAVTQNSSALVESGAVYTAVEGAKTASAVTITEGGASGDVLKSYTFAQGGTTIGTINIPKDLVVTGGSIVTGTWSGSTFTEDAEQPGAGTGKALKLTIANQSNPVYINVKDLVDVYTAGSGIEISAANVVSAKVAAGNGLSVDAEGIKMALSSSTAAGAMSAADKAKLDGITDASLAAWNAAQPNIIESVHVNGKNASINGKDASVTLAGSDVLVGGNGTHAAQTVAAAIEAIEAAAGVSSFAGATGAISVDNASVYATPGHVQFSMDGSTLKAVAQNVAPANVVSSITAHTEHGASNGVDVSVTTTAGQVSAVTVSAPNFANIYETKADATAKYTDIDGSIDRLDASVSANETAIGTINNSITKIDSSLDAFDASLKNHETRIAALESLLTWKTL